MRQEMGRIRLKVSWTSRRTRHVKISTKQILQIHVAGDIRVMTFSADTAFNHLVLRLAAKFDKVADQMQLKFEDDVGDFVSLKDDDDLEWAVDCAR
jgi:hypothetical protein